MMIDTIRFKINLGDKIEAFKSKGSVTLQIDPENGLRIPTFHTNTAPLPSFNYQISSFIYPDKDVLFIEFSAPKVLLGQNVYLIEPNLLKEITIKAKMLIERAYASTLPKIETWIIQRLDICYAWKFDSDLIASNVLDALAACDFARKNRIYRNTSVTYKGSAYDVKFYLKNPEYKKHDFRKLLNADKTDYAFQIFQESTGLLRYEVTMRKDQIQYEYKKEITVNYITSEKITHLLNKYLKKLVSGMNTNIINYQRVKEILFEKYNHKQALSLLDFYTNYFHHDEATRISYRKTYIEQAHRTTIYRKIKLLREANVGISDLNNNIQTKLTIPSQIGIKTVTSVSDALACYAVATDTESVPN